MCRGGVRWLWHVFLGLSVAAFVPPRAQPFPVPKAPVSWKVTSGVSQLIRPGATFRLALTGTIDAGWHIYALDEPEGGPIETTVDLAEGDRADLLHVEEEQPRSVMDPAFRERTMLFQNKAAFVLNLRLGTSLPPGTVHLHVLVRYQSCNDRVCLPPHTDQIDVPVKAQR